MSHLLRRVSPAHLAHWLCWCVGVCCALGLISCGDSKPRSDAPKPLPAAFAPESFTDIPIPLGYMFSPTADQLALIVGDNLIRRFEVSLERRPSAIDQSPEALLEHMEQQLTPFGWQKISSESRRQTWRKAQEHLLLETGRSGGRTTIRLRLRPTQAVGS
jgi:hypothetical protein